VVPWFLLPTSSARTCNGNECSNEVIPIVIVATASVFPYEYIQNIVNRLSRSLVASTIAFPGFEVDLEDVCVPKAIRVSACLRVVETLNPLASVRIVEVETRWCVGSRYLEDYPVARRRENFMWSVVNYVVEATIARWLLDELI